MPLESGKSEKAFGNNVSELMKAFHKKGKIGSSTPKNKRAALAQALAIAYKQKGEK